MTTFPLSPAPGDLYLSNDRTWIWTGTEWDYLGISSVIAELVAGSGIDVSTTSNITTISAVDRTAGRIMGRKTASGDGPAEDLTKAEAQSLLNIWDKTDLTYSLALTLNDDGWEYPMTFHPSSASTSPTWPAANRCIYTRMKSRAAAATKASVSIATSSGNISIGVYSSTGSGISARPTTRIATTGSIACPSSGIATVTFSSYDTTNPFTGLSTSAFVQPGYWIGISVDNNTAALRCGSSAFSMPGICYQETAFPVPATAGSLTASSRRIWGAVHA